MGKKKRSTREKHPNPPQKPRYTLKANLFYSQVIAPLVKAYQQSMGAKNYEEAEQFFNQIREAKKQHRFLLHKKEMIRIR
ncbi:hypothetical protein [Lihuaxuella thermophila]|uniref:Uncharacterized protein n=1 Tax=Lihuaxuella thermophila TaxID=1173111 RepID=A0A1H8ESL3_9BACL|nr:hypothetical protein [Lihuaxuella thermophila]SEN21728.1 hypothetical protein SAMN05444955_107118 [Lihuaxuella thermophila]